MSEQSEGMVSSGGFGDFCRDIPATIRRVSYPRGDRAASKVAIEGINKMLDDGWICVEPMSCRVVTWEGAFVQPNTEGSRAP